MRKHYLLLVLLLLLCGLLNGCWDRRELESLGLVQSLGLDVEPNSKKLIVTTMIAIPSKLGAQGQDGGGSGGDESGVTVISMPAPSIYEGFNLINTMINREITLQQNQNLVLGEELAKRGIGKLVDTLVRFRETRRTLLLFVCRGKAADIFQVQSKLEKNPSEYLNDLVGQTTVNAMFHRVNLNEFMNNYQAFAQEVYAPLLAQYTPMGESGTAKQPKSGQASGDSVNGNGGGNGSAAEQPQAEKKPSLVRIIGTAVFRGEKMVGNLDLYETQIFQLLINQFRQAIVTLDDPFQKKHSIVVRLIGGVPSTRIKYQPRTGKDRFLVKIRLEADLVSIQSTINYAVPQKQRLLAELIGRELDKRVKKVITKVQHEFKSDIFGFGIKVRNAMPTTKAWENYRWPEKFPAAQIDVDVQVALRRAGVQFHPPTLR